MSDEKGKKLRINMSFEEAMKKASTTKMDPAILIEGKDKEYQIPNAAGRSVQFVSLYIPGKKIAQYQLKVHLVLISDIESFILPCKMNTEKADESIFEAQFPNNPKIVPVGSSLIIKVIQPQGVPTTEKDFDTAVLTYKLL